jgi:hypothetical protein
MNTRTVTTLELRRGDRVVLPFPARDGTTPNIRTVNRVIDMEACGIVGNRPLYSAWYDRHDDDRGNSVTLFPKDLDQFITNLVAAATNPRTAS